MTTTFIAEVQHVSTELIETIEGQHAAAELKGYEMICALVECGESLIEARKQVPTGEWLKWISENLSIHPKTVRTYIRFATYQAEIRKHKPVTIRDARRLLAEKTFVQVNDSTPMKKIARKMRSKGYSFVEIGEELGVTAAGAQYWVNGHLKLRRQKQTSKYALRIEKEKARRESVKRKGGQASVAYGHLRKAVQALDEAIRAAKKEQPDLVAALSACYRAEDLIVKASKESTT